MKVFVATDDHQGGRANDFHWAVRGELVWIAPECARDQDDREGIDGGCGCRRAMAGITSQRATTTFTVAELDLSMSEYERILTDALMASVGHSHQCASGLAVAVARELVDLASSFVVGSVLERRGDVIQARCEPARRVGGQ
jgi:hypothetical protein